MTSQHLYLLLIRRHIMLLLLFTLPAVSLADNTPTMVLASATEAEANITVDGVLDEAIWQRLPAVSDLAVIEPDTLATPPFRTEVRFFYTAKGMYVGIWNEQPEATIIERLSPRDSFISRDGNSFTIDPTGTGLYGYWFGVNLGGSLMDGTVLPERQFSNQWDGPWDGAAARVAGGWSTEFFIPWSMMTLPDSQGPTQNIGFYMSRQVAHKNERWAFPALPPTRSVFLSSLQQLQVNSIRPEQQLSVYPYASTSYNNVADRAVASSDTYKAGVDIFWRPTSNTQVSATLNPDFGNVESDNVVVNLTSLETFFPEKRAFFLEGNEIFNTSQRGQTQGRGSPTTLVNTRRIGGPPKATGISGLALTGLEENRPSELAGAAKLTGQQGKIRYGTLLALEEDTLLRGTLNNVAASVEQAGREFAVARVLYEDTSTGARRAVGWMGTLVAHPRNDATVNGLDAHYLSSTGQWNTDVQLMVSRVDGVSGEGAFVDVDYSPQRGRKHSLALDYFGADLEINDFGFLERNDLMGGRYGYTQDDSGVPGIKSRNTSLRAVQYYNTDGRQVKSGLFSSQERIYRNNSKLFYELNYFPRRWDDITSEGNGDYRVDGRFRGGAFFSTDESRTLSAGVGGFYEEEALGGRSHELELELRWRPTDRFSLLTNLGYEDKQGWLLHTSGRQLTTYAAGLWRPKVELDFFLSSRQQFRITAQWAGIKAFEEERWSIPAGDGPLQTVARTADASSRDFSISRLTFQARYRWEIAPLSDLFVVYTRGSDVASRPRDSFESLLRDSWTERLVDVFVVKLRYRLGN